MSSTLYIKGCFGVVYVSQHKVPQPFLSIQKKFKSLHLDRVNNHKFHHLLEIENKETYKSFKYFPQEVIKFPLSEFSENRRSIVKSELPTFYLGCSDHQFSKSKEFIEKSDQLIISTKISGLIQLAEILLDFGTITNEQDVISLENPYAFGGVSRTSIEANFWLPNSLAFYTEKIDDLTF